jgi:hypothetical protein
MTLSRKSHKPAAIHKTKTSHPASSHSTNEESEAAKKLLSMVAKPQLERIVNEEKAVPKPLDNSSATPLGDSFDSRKQFFQMMSQQLDQANPAGSEEAAPKDELDKLVEETDNNPIINRSVNTYRKLAIRFVALAFVLVLVVLYFVMVKLTVIVSPSKQTVNESLIVDVYGSSQAVKSDRALQGNITRIEAEESGVYAASGEEIKGAAVSGQVKLINNYNKSQVLVATTRLLSADNKLFRLKDTITVPAGSSIVATVYADQPGADMAIAPSHFTIPGLWAGIQDKIYGESSVVFTYDTISDKYITQADVDKATQELNDILVKKVKDKVGAKNGYDQVIYQTSAATAQVELVDVKVGDKQSQFTVKIKNIVNVVSFSSDDVIKVAQQKLAAAVAGETTLAEIDRANLAYQLESYNSQSNVATLKVNFSSRVASTNSEFIDKGKLVNLNQSQIETYLKGVKEIDSFELRFFPGFLKRSPALVDRIYVEVK